MNKNMIIRYLIVVLITLVLTTACGVQPTSTTVPNIPDTPTEAQEKYEPVEETLPPAETVTSNCLGDDISPIGQSIADDYESASYEQIMIWFCNGAEFEDILVALETEVQSDTAADDMLRMLADGFTWEEIWQLVGLTD